MSADWLSVAVAALAAFISVIALVSSRRQTKLAARLVRRPVLVFTWDERAAVWVVVNIGSGPALDVVVLKRADHAWTSPLRLAELNVGGQATIAQGWGADATTSLVVRYRSVADERYSSESSEGRTRVVDEWTGIPPGAWENPEPHWKYR
jgi:hypothetical protein